MLNALELTGRVRTHVVQRDDLGAAIHTQALQPFLDMKADAARAGLDIAIVSSFRDFAAQQRIWDLKYRGERPLYDAEGNARDHASLSEDELVDAILCWSALPGGSRHHWGTELDVVDKAAMPEGYRVRLVPAETQPGGVFHDLHCWLDANMARFNFFRPYSTFRGGVLPEAWHLSFAPVSSGALEALTFDVLADAVQSSDMLGKLVVLQKLQRIYERYVANVDAPQSGSASRAV